MLGIIYYVSQVLYIILHACGLRFESSQCQSNIIIFNSLKIQCIRYSGNPRLTESAFLVGVSITEITLRMYEDHPMIVVKCGQNFTHTIVGRNTIRQSLSAASSYIQTVHFVVIDLSVIYVLKSLILSTTTTVYTLLLVHVYTGSDVKFHRDTVFLQPMLCIMLSIKNNNCCFLIKYYFLRDKTSYALEFLSKPIVHGQI